ncbi:MAG: phosphoribosylglycinamide formyltransferase [Proteiniphilum sp.]|nr:phosphoribosylglycinamide formyltransferase [Proteiniphilum sp.]MDD3909184.1 phosphoribosylglycinamide formyltransferase [Proteiniphilum sp.]MDD4415492.1 phosphoribosylglycinamide formyltransferase [Proteiniphilum sp.]
MTRISIFASGNGSNAENIVRYFSDSDDIVVSLIISNKRDAYVHERARHLGIPSFTFSKPEFDDGLLVLDTLREYNIDFIVLAGFLLKLSQPLLDSYPERIVNIHPALLPRHGGKGMYGDRVHRAVVDSGDKESGITIHFVNENYDEGSIIYQATCEVNKEDTTDDIARKVHVLEYTHYPRVIEEVVKKIASGE